MCRNITPLRGLDPPATEEEVRAAALQYVRKVGALAAAPAGAAAVDAAVEEVAAATARLLAALPARRRPPTTVPPLRRPEVRARLAGSPATAPGSGAR